MDTTAATTQHRPLDAILVEPRIVPPLDPGFRPAVLARRGFEERLRAAGGAVRAAVALEQPGGSVAVREFLTVGDGDPDAPVAHALVERLVKYMLWAHGGARVWVDGPSGLVAALRRHYAEDPAGRFDAEMLGQRIYGHAFEVVAASRSAFPASHAAGAALGRHLEGCRIGFDLGASDRKSAAVIDGEVVFSEEILWSPTRQADPQWHFDEIMDSLRRAAAHLPRVDAIGGSAAGVYVGNEIRVASLFRGVPPDLFAKRVRGLFHEMADSWGGIPFEVVNDGEVTALAGAMLSGVDGMLGIAMGSSEAAGYVRPDGTLTAGLNELAFVPLDLGPDAAVDEWSGDRGCGVQYLSQQATGRLLGRAGIDLDPSMPLPERLVELQRLMAAGDDRAALVYDTVGTYLGYALLDASDFYEFEHLLLLGRVTTGSGGDRIASRARSVLEAEDRGRAATLTFHTVSERDKRHGQAVAAASLPALRRE